jgi:hypothetical protein
MTSKFDTTRTKRKCPQCGEMKDIQVGADRCDECIIDNLCDRAGLEG